MFLYFFYLVQFSEYISHTMHVYPTLLQKENFPKKFQGNGEARDSELSSRRVPVILLL